MAGASEPRIEALLSALRAAGLGLGVTGSLRVAEVLRATAREAGGAAGRSVDVEELRDLLRCVVVSTMEERTSFDRVFAAWSDGAQGALGMRHPGLASVPGALAESLGARAERASGPPRKQRARPWFLGAVAAAALGGIAAVGVLAWRFSPPAVVEGADAGTMDAGLVEQDDGGVSAPGRPTTFRARSVVFTVEPPRAERAIPWQLALTLVSAGLAVALGRFVRRAGWLPRVLAPPRVPGPPDVPSLPLAEGRRGAGLFTSAERDDLAFAVDRFIREEPSPEVDAPRSRGPPPPGGGGGGIGVPPRLEHRTVWLWADAASPSPLVPRFAAEVAASLAAAGLPSECGRFACVPDRVDADERGALEPREIEDAALGSAVLLVTDGDGLARRLADSASRGWVRPVLRVLSRWPRVAFVAVSDEGRRALSAAFVRFEVGVSVLGPDEVQAFLGGQDVRRAPRERPRMTGDSLAWAAGCCVSGRAVDAGEALALRAAMELDAPVWELEAVLAEIAGVRRRAARLRWLTRVSGAGLDGVEVPKDSPLWLALAFFRKRLAEEDAERTRRDAEDPWADTPAQRELLRRGALLDLWTAPDEALGELHRLYATDDPARCTALVGYAVGASRVELRASDEGVIALPWAMLDLGDTARLLAQDLGLRVLGGNRWSRGVPGRAILAVGGVLGLCVGAGVGAVARWATRPVDDSATCAAPEGGWCDVATCGNSTCTVRAGSGREGGSKHDVPRGARVTAVWGPQMRVPCEEPVDARTSIRHCGKREAPVPRGSGWVAHDSVGAVVGDEGNAERDAWADALLDSGSADRVVVTSDPGAILWGPSNAPGFQMVIVNLMGSAARQSNWAVAELVPGGGEREALTGTEVREVAETWPNAKVLSGHPQLAGVAVARGEPDGGAPAPAAPVGPIHDSSDCAYTFPEHACPKQTEPLSRVDKGHWLLLCGMKSTPPNRLVIGANSASGEPFSAGYLYQVRASINAKGICGDPEVDYEARFRVYPADVTQDVTTISLEVLPDAFKESDDMYFCVTAQKGTASRVSGRIHVKRSCR